MNMLNNNIFLITIPAKEILNAAVGHKEAFLIDENHSCFIIEFEHINEGQK